MSIKIFNTNVLVKMIEMQSLQRQEIRYFYYWFSHKTDYYIKISDIENKIPSSIGLVKKNCQDTEITEIENKMQGCTNSQNKKHRLDPSITRLTNKYHLAAKFSIANTLNYSNASENKIKKDSKRWLI